MPAFLEQKLKKQYPNNPGAVFGTMNKMGAMKGNQETQLGREMERDHDTSETPAKKLKPARINKTKVFGQAMLKT